MKLNKTTRLILSIFILLFSLYGFNHSLVSGVFLLISALLILPKTSDIITEKLSLSSKVKNYSAVVLFILGIVASDDTPADSNSNNETNRVQSEMSVRKPLISITAPQLVRDYHDNEVRADNAYKGKEMLITGIVESINKDFMGDVYIVLRGDGYINNVHCDLDNENIAASLSKGQQVTFKGKCDGMVMGSVFLKNCKLE